MKKINVNIWDDYTEDEDVEPGQLQKTHLYVEDSSITQADQRKYLLWLLPHLQQLAPTVRFELVESPNPDDENAGPEFQVLGLSHADRKVLVTLLRRANLRYSNQLYYNIFSES